MSKQVVGLIGTGVMGKSMAANILAAGHQVLVYSRTKAKADELLTKGATWVDTPASMAKKADVIITMVGFPTDVESIYFGKDGLLENGHAGMYVIDMTTSTPTLAKKIAEEANRYQIHALDAPVSGGDIGAKTASLAIMVGGEEADFTSMVPLFETIGKNIVYQGKAGAGQHTKMCNQIAIASNMLGVCEAIVYAKKAGLDQETVLQSISTGAAGSWSLSNLAPRMLNEDFAPGFYIKHFIKDMKIALEEAKRMDMETPGLATALSLYEQLVKDGEEDSGTQALYKYWK